ncbi:MAG: hypothetical protein HYZ85_01575 [Candidatus Omnitrophica bacterium]|nr:hypothetical protein [Candidatus Omnitrophota bacterium]
MVKIKKIHHLIRYFVPFGILVFFGYQGGWVPSLFLFLAGPVLYLAYGLRRVIVENIIQIPYREGINDFVFLLPMCIGYSILTGFLFKQLLNERGFTRNVSLIALASFLIFIHYAAWQHLLEYFELPEFSI